MATDEKDEQIKALRQAILGAGNLRVDQPTEWSVSHQAHVRTCPFCREVWAEPGSAPLAIHTEDCIYREVWKATEPQRIEEEKRERLQATEKLIRQVLETNRCVIYPYGGNLVTLEIGADEPGGPVTMVGDFTGGPQAPSTE